MPDPIAAVRDSTRNSILEAHVERYRRGDIPFGKSGSLLNLTKVMLLCTFYAFARFPKGGYVIQASIGKYSLFHHFGAIDAIHDFQVRQ